jgi:hypothetical protein
MSLKQTSVLGGYEQITGLSSVKGLTVPDPKDGQKITFAVIECESQTVRWRDDLTDPTTSVGMRLEPGDVIEYDGNLTTIKFIEEAASAKLNVSYYG